MSIGINGYGQYDYQSVSYVGQKSYLKTAPDGSVTMNNGVTYDENSAEVKSLKRSGAVECETCKNRKYQDGSNESDVSFKAPGHISPQASAATVAAHEQQHVANAYEKAGNADGKVVSASVTLKTAVCPECGRSYVSGGETNTMIRYSKDAYGQNAKSLDAANGALGQRIDYAV